MAICYHCVGTNEKPSATYWFVILVKLPPQLHYGRPWPYCRINFLAIIFTARYQEISGREPPGLALCIRNLWKGATAVVALKFYADHPKLVIQLKAPPKQCLFMQKRDKY